MTASESKGSRPQGYWRVPELLPDLDSGILGKLEALYSDLIRFNQTINLISRNTELDADMLHIYDGVVGGQIILSASQASAIYDIGSGNGIPGLVLAILDPEREIILVDRDERKCEFLKLMVGRLGLKSATVLVARFEDLEPESVECAVSRGFASLTKTLLLARRACSVGGEYFHFKGSNWIREVSNMPSQVCAYWTPELVKEYELPHVHARMAIVRTKRVG